MVLVMLHDLVLKIFGFRLDVWMVWISVFFTVISAWDYIVKNRKCIDFK